MTTIAPRRTSPAALAAVALAATLAAVPAARGADKADAPQLAHSVFFTLKDRTPAAREKLVSSCYKHLTGHEGAVSFTVATIAEDVDEPGVAVRDFDVALLVVFESKAAEAKYLKHPRHLQFVDENKATFAKVRVFDSYVTKP